MFIKDDKRIISEDGTKTYRAFGLVFNIHNRFFSGSVIIKIKYGHRDVNRAIDVKLKHAVTFVKDSGINLKYFELRLISIPKGK